jgi:UDP-glucose 4-epimerase
MRVYGRAFRIHMAPRRPGDAASVVADATLAHRELGWAPKYNCMETIVRSSLEWEIYLAHRSGFDASGLRKVFAAPSI